MPLLERQPTQYSQQPSVNPESLSIQETLQPSKELAWMLGVLSMRGFVDAKKGLIEMQNRDDEFLEKFRQIGETVFCTNAYYKPRKTRTGKETRVLVLRNPLLIQQLGNLNSNHWTTTLMEKHSWIFKTSYTWDLLSGIFECRGIVKRVKSARTEYSVAVFRTDYLHVANFISELLVRVGITRPKIEKDSSNKEGIRGVGLYYTPDVLSLAQNLAPRSSKKLQLLERLRQPAIQLKTINYPISTQEEAKKSQEQTSINHKGQIFP